MKLVDDHHCFLDMIMSYIIAPVFQRMSLFLLYTNLSMFSTEGCSQHQIRFSRGLLEFVIYTTFLTP
jgi:hypothetical protein